MEYNHRKREDVLAAIDASAREINRLHNEGTLNARSEVFSRWKEDHWIGILEAAENLKNGIEAEEGIKRATLQFDNPMANSDIVAYNVAKYIYFTASEEVRAELGKFIPQEVKDL